MGKVRHLNERRGISSPRLAGIGGIGRYVEGVFRAPVAPLRPPLRHKNENSTSYRIVRLAQRLPRSRKPANSNLRQAMPTHANQLSLCHNKRSRAVTHPLAPSIRLIRFQFLAVQVFSRAFGTASPI